MPVPVATVPSTAQPRTVSGWPTDPATGASMTTSGPGVTRRIAPLVAPCASGLTTLIVLSPGVAPTVDTLIVTVVGPVRVTLLTVTPGMAAPIRQRKPGPGSTNAVPPLDVAVTCRSIEATPLAMTDGVTPTGVAAPRPTVRATASP